MEEAPMPLHEERVRKIDSQPSDRIDLAIVGVGTLGATVAQLALSTGLKVLMVVRPGDEKKILASEMLDEWLRREVFCGRMSSEAAVRARSLARITSSFEALHDCDVVLESVAEDLLYKRAILANIEASVRPDCLIASTTSSLPAAWIAAETAHPERVAVAHYVWPAHRIPLVEVAFSTQTAQAHKDRLHELLRRQGKMWVEVKDKPGFLTTRVLFGYWSETLELVREGVSPTDIDRAMEEFGWPMGPCRVMDGAGLETILRVQKCVAPFLGGRIDGLARIGTLVAAGHVGGRSRSGFYVHDADGTRPNDAVIELSNIRLSEAPTDIVDRLMGAMLNEAAHCIAEGIVASWEEASFAVDYAFRFPARRGGMLGYLRSVRPTEVVARLEFLCAKHGPRFRPSAAFAEAARTTTEVIS
ncbi:MULTISPECIES: 3-hydroxyacyl-CoA dehydrogenase family protein [Sorangium]|uniref:3-hydroxyacyl-CoA dehydrogenase n=1 Tax=Sorangium cellulosum TaxID=56 RepID=A0A4V0NI14_SORCE|nr:MULTISPECIES: 3-hydroxyacyl-CoA dehydrogenase family protein [Sorangium]AUX38582.1 uncharacterized protein SOCE836_108290 [Sorangium cellulosum]WCQ97867.1 Fatty acid oxidation complex subunit alpha [Sorangium sp. Soce836]